MIRIGVLGLGEAGGAIAADVRAAGVAVAGPDPDPATCPDAPNTAARQAARTLGTGQVPAHA